MKLKKIALVTSVFLTGIFVGTFLKGFPIVNASVETQAPSIWNERGIEESFNQSFPKSSITINRSCYALGYDCRTRNAAWVYERLTADSLKGDADREKISFKEDPLIPTTFRSTLKDYQKSGFDRGHLAPAANHKGSLDEMRDTFFLSNMSPQEPQFNRGYWSKVEKYVRDLTKSNEVVEVITGPLYLPKEEADGSKWVKYRVIGDNDVAVPTHFFKVVVLSSKGKKEDIAYILPNEPIAANTPLDRFKVTVDKVEKCAGVLFSSYKD